jgi:hypothetical protein
MIIRNRDAFHGAVPVCQPRAHDAAGKDARKQDKMTIPAALQRAIS